MVPENVDISVTLYRVSLWPSTKKGLGFPGGLYIQIGKNSVSGQEVSLEEVTVACHTR